MANGYIAQNNDQGGKMMALSPEILVPRLGEVLISEGLITEEQLNGAIEEQKRISSGGSWTRIGELLISMGYISRESLNQAITQQILRFQQALLESNRTLEARVVERTVELENAYQKLSELDLLKSNFVSAISHELRTPLTHIKGYIDLLLNSQGIDSIPDAMQSLNIMQRSTERLEGLINDLIMFSAAENGKLMLCYESFNLKEITELVIARYTGFSKNTNLKISLDSRQEVITINADRNKITWVINQFIDNAVKFSNYDGSISIQLDVVGDQALIAIEDHGAGMTKTQADEAFQPFHQLNGKANRPYGGTGIGLALARRIIEAHGSEIKVRTSPGQGSCFQFKLPLVH